MTKFKLTPVYSAIALGVIVVIGLLLCPPSVWEKLGATGKSGRVVFSNVHESWKSRRSGAVVSVADAPMTRTYAAPVARTSKSSCQRWHKVRGGQTQWFLANAYNNQKNKQLWLKGMRKLSGKHPHDVNLKVGETICVKWSRLI